MNRTSRQIVHSAAASLLGFTIFAHAAEFQFGRQTLQVPDGFEIELVSNTNLVKRPVSMDFDELGRLYVTDSSGSSDKGPTQYEKKDHRVMRLEDTDGDGKFDASTVFADRMMFPEGCLYYEGSVYVAAPPSIWKLTDTNNDGIADVRVEWHQGKTLTGCANDLHGPYLGRDGWIYWCKGAFAEQTYEVHGKPFTTKASHIFRARPDRSGIEPVLTGGMDNPVGVAFARAGDRFLAGTFFEPQIPGRRDGVIHAIYGGVYGKPHPDVLNSHQRTGDLMPVMIHLGPSASCDLIFYESKVFGADFQNNLLVCNFNLHNVTRHGLEPDGATFKTTDSVFLTCDNDPDFHPTCLKEDADGSLLVIDTGGWYKICCPTSQLYKPDVLGAIYRIRKKGAPKVEDGRGLKIDWANASVDALVTLLDDARPFVVQRATRTLAGRGDAVVPALAKVLETGQKPVFKPKNARKKEVWHQQHQQWVEEQKRKAPSTSDHRQNVLWTLTQIDAPSARNAVRAALFDFDEPVRLVAYESISLLRDREGAREIIEALSTYFSAREWRAVFEAIGRCGLWDDDALMEVWANVVGDDPMVVSDRVVRHSFAYSLIEAGANSAAQFFFNSSEPGLKMVGLIALDQLRDPNLKAMQVAPLLTSTNVALKEIASWVVSHHPEWGGALAGFFESQIAVAETNDAIAAELEKRFTQFASDPAIQKLLSSNLRRDGSIAQSLTLHALANANVKEPPAEWLAELSRLLRESKPERLRESVMASSKFAAKSDSIAEGLRQVADNTALPSEIRLQALAAGAAGREMSATLFQFVIDQIGPQEPVNTRGLAVSTLTRAKLSDNQLIALSRALQTVGPMELTRLVGIFEKTTNAALGERLVTDLAGAKAIASLRPDRVKALFAKYPEAVQAKANELVAALDVDAAQQSARLDQLVATLKSGDIRRGQMVFNSSKAACSACHRIGYLGGKVGPDLTNIGKARTERDLLESVIYPNASFVRSFEPMIVITKSGDDFSGIITKDTTEELVLATGHNVEVRLARSDVTEVRPGSTSVMPGGLDEQLSREELADLIAFLKHTEF